MTLRNANPLRFSPKGLSDSVDETDEFPGACSILSNLVPDNSTKNVWVPRPAAITEVIIEGGNTPVQITALIVIGEFVYGMASATTGALAGFDIPFCYNVTFSVVGPSGVDATSLLPATVPTTGDWVPPTMDVVGPYVVVTHPGFSSPNFFGWFDTTDPNNPVWHAGNLFQVGAILTLNTLAGGSGYTPGYYGDVPLTGGTGTGARASINVRPSGIVGPGTFSATGVNITNPGEGYVVGDVLSASAASIGGTGSGFSIHVASVMATGAIAMTTVPAWVRNYNGRAWFGVNPPTGLPSAIFTDVLSLSCANANQALTFGSSDPLTAACPLPLSNQLGGVIASLIIFRRQSGIIQITGDQSTNNLAVTPLLGGTGTASPRSIVGTPKGVAFLDHDGYRLIDFGANVSDPIGIGGSGVVVPFLSQITPSRVAAGCNGSVVRVSTQNVWAPGQPWQEYWYDIARQLWSGPHTFPGVVYANYGASFFMAVRGGHGLANIIFSSDVNQSPASTFVENGVQLTWTFQTVMLMDQGQMAESEIAEMQVKTSAVPAITSVVVSALDQNAAVLGTLTYAYGSVTQALAARQISFPAPVVYNRLAIKMTGKSALGYQIGDIFVRSRVLGYMQPNP